MIEELGAVVTALWLGILASISPCPLAANVAAVSFVGRDAGHPWRVLASGLAYSAGRALTYVAVATIVVAGVLSVPGLSFFLQQRVNQWLGPLLLLIGAGLLGWLPLRWPAGDPGARLRERVAGRGILGAGLLGGLLALSFCPVSAGLFFGGLMPLAVGARSRFVLPAVFGLGTGLPVLLFALLLVLGARGVARAFGAITAFERVGRIATGAVFLGAGAWLVATHLLGLFG